MTQSNFDAFLTRITYSLGSNETSHVLNALGISDDLPAATIRIGVGRFKSEQELDFKAEAIANEVFQ